MISTKKPFIHALLVTAALCASSLPQAASAGSVLSYNNLKLKILELRINVGYLIPVVKLRIDGAIERERHRQWKLQYNAQNPDHQLPMEAGL